MVRLRNLKISPHASTAVSGRRVLVVGAKEAQQWSREVRDFTNDRFEVERHIGGGIHRHEGAVAVDDAV
jgi:hypothetical protein